MFYNDVFFLFYYCIIGESAYICTRIKRNTSWKAKNFNHWPITTFLWIVW